jgi:hypothetical protein
MDIVDPDPAETGEWVEAIRFFGTRRERSTGRGPGGHRALCPDVRGGCTVALSPLDDRRCIARPRIRVEDVIGPKGRKPHIFTAFSHVDGRRLPIRRRTTKPMGRFRRD